MNHCKYKTQSYLSHFHQAILLVGGKNTLTLTVILITGVFHHPLLHLVGFLKFGFLKFLLLCFLVYWYEIFCMIHSLIRFLNVVIFVKLSISSGSILKTFLTQTVFLLSPYLLYDLSSLKLP